jgi:hypothetical protein
MSKNENPSKQNDILVVVKVTLIYFTFWLVGPFTLAIWCEVPHCFEDRNATSRWIVLDRLVMEMGCCLLDIYPYPFFFILKYLLCHQWRKAPNFSHYYVWQKPSSKWHTVFVQIPTFVLFFVCFFVFFCVFFDFDQFLYKLWDWKLKQYI